MTLRKIGGIWFAKLGRFNVSFSVSKPKVCHRLTNGQTAWGSTHYQRERMGNLAMARRMARA